MEGDEAAEDKVLITRRITARSRSRWLRQGCNCRVRVSDVSYEPPGRDAGFSPAFSSEDRVFSVLSNCFTFHLQHNVAVVCPWRMPPVDSKVEDNLIANHTQR